MFVVKGRSQILRRSQLLEDDPAICSSPESALIARRSDLRRIFHHEPSSMRVMVETVLSGKVGHEWPIVKQAGESLTIQKVAMSAVSYVSFCRLEHLVHAYKHNIM